MKTKRPLGLTALLLGLVLVTAACSGPETLPEQPQPLVDETAAADEPVARADYADLPTLAIGYPSSTHQAPLLVAATMGGVFAGEDVYLREVSPREAYILVVDDQDTANINLVAADNGAEVMTMLAQGRLQLGLSALDLAITQIDQGAGIKVLGPVHRGGMGLIAANDLPALDFDGFVASVEAAAEPVQIGYHSPSAAPRILFEAALRELGLTVTENPADPSADILLIDLAATEQLLSALASGEVVAWVGPSPFPELALLREEGRLISGLQDLPPPGRWTDFPCCVVAAADTALAEQRDLIEQLYKLLTVAANYANDNKETTARIVADWLGLDEEAASNTMLVYTTDANQNWLEHCALTYDALQEHGSLTGIFADAPPHDLLERLFDLSVATNARDL